LALVIDIKSFTNDSLGLS